MAKPKVKFVPESLHVCTGDVVYVISGKDKGKTGRVLKVFPKKGKIVVEGVNMVTKHVKPNAQNHQGGIVERPAALFSSKVMLFDEKAGKPTKAVYKDVDGKKVRHSKVSGAAMPVPKLYEVVNGKKVREVL